MQPTGDNLRRLSERVRQLELVVEMLVGVLSKMHATQHKINMDILEVRAIDITKFMELVSKISERMDLESEIAKMRDDTLGYSALVAGRKN